MKQFAKILIAAAAAASVASVAHAQASANQSTTSTATIFRPIQLVKDTDLSFGTIVRPDAGSGTVTISEVDGTRSLSGSGALLSTGPNAPAGRATYTVSGEGGQTFAITVPANFNMTRVGGSETITVVLTPSATTGTLSGALGDTASGSATFGVGGQIPVSNTTTSGAYSGVFTTTVSYN